VWTLHLRISILRGEKKSRTYTARRKELKGKEPIFILLNLLLNGEILYPHCTLVREYITILDELKTVILMPAAHYATGFCRQTNHHLAFSHMAQLNYSWTVKSG
jgi:hypothetical protein